MNKQLIETVIGALVLFAASYFFITVYGASDKQVGADNYVVKASFSDVTGVNSGGDVRISGVKIGTVQGLRLDEHTYQAELTMLINDNIKIPEDSTATIVGESLLGGKFVAIGVGGSENMLKNDGKIEFTQPSVSLEQLLGKFVFSGGGIDAGATDEVSPKHLKDGDGSKNNDEIKLNMP